jgi:cobalt-zinc-cadmium efflux system outer membrane protein
VFITYPIDWFLFGKRAAAMTATQYAVHVTQSEFQDLVRLRVLAVSGAFFDLVEAAGLQELGRATVDNLEQVEKTTALAVEVGKRPAVELNRIRLDVLGARQELRRSQATFLTAEAALRETTGLANWPGTLMANWPLGTPLESDAATVEEAIVIAERERPDLEAARWQVAKTGADVVVQERAARPTVAPALGCTRQYQKEMAMPDANSWNANVTMSVPIFDRNQGNIAKACAAQRQAQFSYGAKVLQVQAEVRQAIAELRAAEDNAGAVADEQLELAKKVRDSIVEAYGLGGRPLIDVLDAQRNYRETYRLYITTRTAFWRALYRYRAALGAQAASHE